jgi:hypothetical protein
MFYPRRMGLRPTARAERLASASCSGIGKAYARGRLTGHHDDALAELADVLHNYRIPADRRCAVLSDAAIHFLDGEHDEPTGMTLLVEAGGDEALARAIRAETHNWPRA